MQREYYSKNNADIHLSNSFEYFDQTACNMISSLDVKNCVSSITQVGVNELSMSGQNSIRSSTWKRMQAARES